MSRDTAAALGSQGEGEKYAEGRRDARRARDELRSMPALALTSRNSQFRISEFAWATSQERIGNRADSIMSRYRFPLLAYLL